MAKKNNKYYYMSNTLNLRLSNFVDSDFPATEGRDFFIDNKTLFVPLSSDWLSNVTRVVAVNKGLKLLDPSRAPQLKTLVVSDSAVNLVYPGGSNFVRLSAVGITTPVLSLTGANVKEVLVSNSSNLRVLDVSQVPALTAFTVTNNPSLSTIGVGVSAVNLTTTRNVVIKDNSLTQQTVFTFFNTLTSYSYPTGDSSVQFQFNRPLSGGGVFEFGDTNVTLPAATVLDSISAGGIYGLFNIISYQFGQYVFGELV